MASDEDRAFVGYVVGTVTAELAKLAASQKRIASIDGNMLSDPMISTLVLDNGVRIRLSVEIIDVTQFPGETDLPGGTDG